MGSDDKPNLTAKIETWSKYLGLVSALVSVLTSLSGNPLIAYIALGILGVIVGEHSIRVIFQKSSIQQAYHVLLPPSVTERGDLVYRYPTTQRRQAMIWLGGLSLLFVVTGGINLYKAIAPPVTPAREGESLILILPFQPVGTATLNEDVSTLIYQKLFDAFSSDENIRIEKDRLKNVVITTEAEADKLGHATNAALVIWGMFGDNLIYPHFQVIENDQITQVDLGVTPLQTSSKDLFLTITTEVPQSMLYLVNFTKGQISYLAGDYDAAIEYFNNAFETLEEIHLSDPDTEQALTLHEEYVYFYRGNTFAKQDLQRPARKDYQLAIEKAPDFAEAYNNLGVIHFLLGYFEEAIGQFNLAIETAKGPKGLPVAYYNRGSIYYHQKDFKQAVSDFTHAIEEGPGSPIFYQARADSYSFLCNYGQARDDLTIAIDLLKDEPESKARALTNRGGTYTRLGEYDQALHDYEQALTLDPDNPSTYYNLAATKSLMGDPKGAIEALKIALEADETLKNRAACDTDFDSIRNHPQMPPLMIPEEECPPVTCP